MAKYNGGLFFLTIVGITVRHNRLFQFFKNAYTQYNDLIFGLYVFEALRRNFFFFFFFFKSLGVTVKLILGLFFLQRPKDQLSFILLLAEAISFHFEVHVRSRFFLAD